MVVKTKKFALDKKKYVKLAFSRQLKKVSIWLLIPAAIAVLGLVLNFTGVYKNWWILITAIVGAILFVAFWYLQFYAATQMEQNAQMFERFAYEIDSRQIMVKINKKEGGIIKWDTIQSAEKTDDAYLLHVSRGQFFHFPFTAFNSDHDKRLMESILTRKSLL
ncbi:YcxB-like protein [Spirosomataceae bacterium TFI 002]|nr:YcxB-like protein [Spirosomataceae bacterium TFI 002]